MRVCSPELGVGPEATLGGAVYDRELLAAMAAAGAEVSILLPEGEPVSSEPAWSVSRTRRHLRSYYEYNWIFFRELGIELSRRPFDVLRVHSPYCVGIGGLAFAKPRKIPTVLHYLHVEPRSFWQGIDRLTLSRYSHIVTISQATRADLLSRYPLDPAAISVVYPGVDSRYSPGEPDSTWRQRWGASTVCLFIGSLIPRKNLEVAIDALAILRARHVDVRLVVGGEGNHAPALRAHAARASVADRVDFLGRVSESEKLSLLRSADLFVFPSVREGFGMAPAEAMACGLPVVAAAAGPNVEFMRDQVTGILVNPALGAAAFAEAIQRLTDNEMLRRQMGDAARSAAVRLSWSRAATEVIDLYREVVARGQ